MIENLPVYDIYNKPKTVFNISDYTADFESITAQDLINYANKQKVNVFTQLNEFKAIKFYDTINDIDSSTFDYIGDLTDYAQKQIDDINDIILNFSNQIETLETKTTNINYDDNTTTINELSNLNDTLIQNNLSIASNLSIGSNLNVNKITCFDIYNKYTKSYITDTKILKINNSPFYDTICYLYTNTNLTIPISKSTFTETLNMNVQTINKITIKENVLFQIVDINNNIEYSIYNDTDNFLYNKDIVFYQSSYKINIYINNIII